MMSRIYDGPFRFNRKYEILMLADENVVKKSRIIYI